MENNDLYPYKAVIETLVNFGNDAKSCMLQSILYYKDTAGKHDSMATDNTGYVAKNAVVQGSKELLLQGNEVVGPLHIGLFFSRKVSPKQNKN